MGFENSPEELAPEPSTEQTPEENAYNNRQSKAKALFAAGVAALGITIAEQSPIMDLHREKIIPPEHTQQISAEQLAKAKPPTLSTLKGTANLEQPAVSIDSQVPTKDIYIPDRAIDIKLSPKVTEMEPATNIDLKEKTTNIDLHEKVTDIDLREKVIEMKPPR